MSDELTVLTALVAGVLGSTHCLGMCGGIAGALGASARAASDTPGGILGLTVLFSVGRIIGYSIIGAVAGLAGAGIAAAVDIPLWGAIARAGTGLLMVLIGLQIAFRWPLLRSVEQGGARFWTHIAPLAKRLLPVRSAGEALLLGVLWGWLPCGLVYSILLLALVGGDPLESAILMAMFGLGTLPAMTLTGLAGTRVKLVTAKPVVRLLGGFVLVAFGFWTALGPLSHVGGRGEHHHHATTTGARQAAIVAV
ncbi:MAG: sulfite exporter TauE/SafE family protein [Gammaproteobacteria bacterium]|nr:MAG: sulfite exporter TauE/SafE family protein [Gammaproteobacteria bacterium]